MKLKGLGLTGLMLFGNAHAAGFALYEHSASALGTAFTGQAVAAGDASTIFANPAGLSRVVGRQVVVAATPINSSDHFSDGTGGDAGGGQLVPSLYCALDLQPDIKLGVGLFAPFGLKTDYEGNWTGRGQAILSDLKTANLNPTVAWKVSDRLSLGLGIDYQYVKATLSKGPMPGLVSTMEGDDTTWGYNLGLLYDIDDATRVGLSYRSSVDYHLTGTLSVNAPLPGYPQPIYSDVRLPGMASLALQRRLNDRWTVMADATWTGWSVFETLDVHLAANGATVDSTQENWRDAWRFGLGAVYRGSGAWTWRFGVAYDQTPVPDAARRTARVPDADRVSVAFGARYAMSERTLVDLGYMHIFFRDAPTSSDGLTGSYDNHADVFGVQWTQGF